MVMLNGKMKKKLSVLFKGLFTIITPLILIFVTFYFLGNVETKDNDILFKCIKYAIYVLDFIATFIILKNVFGMLYDLDIIKSRRHKVKIKEDDE